MTVSTKRMSLHENKTHKRNSGIQYQSFGSYSKKRRSATFRIQSGCIAVSLVYRRNLDTQRPCSWIPDRLKSIQDFYSNMAPT